MAVQGPVAALAAPHAALASGCCAATPSSTVWTPPAIDASALLAAPDGASRLAAAILAAPDGVLLLRNALEAPFASIASLFGGVTAERAARANAAYQAGTSRLVWKDAHGEGRCALTGALARQADWQAAAGHVHSGRCSTGCDCCLLGACQPVGGALPWRCRGGPHVDLKRVIDLSPRRMDSLTR